MMATRTAAGRRDTEVTLALADDLAFRYWYDRAVPRVFSYLVSRVGDVGLAEELTQQTFVAAIEQRDRFDGRSDSITWLCAIARHKLADHFRRREREERRQARITVRELQLDAGNAEWRSAEDRDAIAGALSTLPAAQRAALTFVALDGLPVAEVGRLMGKSAGATQSLLNRARERFRHAYGLEAGDD
jgi:RNA polymerase sigma-70 factor, ECF subfamily